VVAGKDRQSPRDGAARSGTTGAVQGDPTNMPGQYGPDIFPGIPVPMTSGAMGTPPASASVEPESVNQAAQYPARDPFTGVDYPQAGSGSGGQPPGSAGRAADAQAVDPAAQYQTIGSTIYGATEEDHAMENAPARPDGYYPPTTNTFAVVAPRKSGGVGGDGSGNVRAPGNPNAGK
jgi:hypothetical protein